MVGFWFLWVLPGVMRLTRCPIDAMEILSSALHSISDSDLLSSIRQGRVTDLPKMWLTRDMTYYERDGLLRREARRRNLL